MYQISKRFEFSASHQLEHLPPEHPCARLHGHNYVVEVVIESPYLDDRGFAQVDYRELDGFAEWLKNTVDHRHLNDIVPFRTTAENLARWLLEQVCQSTRFVKAVRVSETPRTWATYTP